MIKSKFTLDNQLRAIRPLKRDFWQQARELINGENEIDCEKDPEEAFSD